jgi:hypothetical protein
MSENQFQSLNQEFYAAKPGTYFRDRLKLLAVRAAPTEALAGLVADDLTWGPLRIVGDGSEVTEEDEQREKADRQRFLVTESQMLLHHVSESLLRMFLAHEGRPECPWLEMAALLDFNEFRAEVEALAKGSWPQERIDAVADVFLGGVAVDPPEEWIEHRDTAVRLLRLLAQRLQGDKKLYNSAKHGLTCLAGEGSIQLYTQDWEPVIGAEGVNVVFLEREGTRKSGYTWYQKTQWLNPEQAAWLAHLATVQMEALWTVARWRYLGETPDGLHLVKKEAIDAYRERFARGGAIQSWRQAVATEEPIKPTNE